MDFDEQTPFLKAVAAVPAPASAQDDLQSWLAASIGLAHGKFTTDERMKATRGED